MSIKKLLRKPARIVLTVVMGLILLAALLYFVVAPIWIESQGGLTVWPWDSFVKVLDEYDVLMDSILIPLYPNSNPRESVPDSKTITLYFKEHDFTVEIDSLNGLYAKAVQADKDSADQRPKARNSRGNSLITMKKKIDTVHAAMEIIQRHIEENSGVFTKEEDEALWNFMRLRSLPMRTH